MIVDGEELSHLHSQVGEIPDLSWTVQTTSQQNGLLQAALFKANDDPNPSWDLVACETVASPSSLFSNVSISNGTSGKTYTLTATSTSGLFSQLNTLEAGKYQVRFSGEACTGGDWSGIPFPTKTGPLLRKGGSYRINYGKVWKSK